MKNRFFKFLMMLLIVVAVGSGATMFNLHLQSQEKNESMTFSAHPMMDRSELSIATTEAVLCQVTEPETKSASPLMDEVYETQPYGAVSQEFVQDPLEEEAKRYYARLQDMELVYAARMNASADGTLSEQQKTAEELLEIWDNELNAVYQKLRKSMPQDEFYLLRNEERAWIRNRDEAANKSASKENYSKSTQNLAYTTSLLRWTRERVYQLAEMYYGEP